MTINILHESIKSDIVNLESAKLLFNRAGGKMSEYVKDLK